MGVASVWIKKRTEAICNNRVKRGFSFQLNYSHLKVWKVSIFQTEACLLQSETLQILFSINKIKAWLRCLENPSSLKMETSKFLLRHEIKTAEVQNGRFGVKNFTEILLLQKRKSFKWGELIVILLGLMCLIRMLVSELFAFSKIIQWCWAKIPR